MIESPLVENFEVSLVMVPCSGDSPFIKKFGVPLVMVPCWFFVWNANESMR